MNPELALTQAWMKTVLVSRGDLGEKLSLAQQQSGLALADVVKGEFGLERRLDVYATGYVLRLVACLKQDYPDLQKFMGEAMFELFAKAFVVTFPPDSWSLAHLSQRFPAFLKNTQPKNFNSPQDKAFYDLPGEIALLERAKAEVAVVKGLEHLAQQPASFFTYMDQQKVVQTAPCLQLLKLAYDVPNFLEAFHANEDTPLPEAKTTFVAVTRERYRVQVVPLVPWAFFFLEVCSQAKTIAQAMTEVSDREGISKDELMGHLLLWLPMAERACLLCAKS